MNKVLEKEFSCSIAAADKFMVYVYGGNDPSIGLGFAGQRCVFPTRKDSLEIVQAFAKANGYKLVKERNRDPDHKAVHGRVRGCRQAHADEAAL